MFGDHPRSRGEHINAWRMLLSVAGSSPLARGARLNKRSYCVVVRIIPARAGSTRSTTTSTLRGRDHPRSRGEHRKRARIGPVQIGSSPLARGAHPNGTLADPVVGIIPARAGARPGRRADRAPDRIIPARAGSTFRSSTRRKNRWDHPRSRGEHEIDEANWVPEWGSSPLARGAHSVAHPSDTLAGIIPARRGSTLYCALYVGRATDHPRSARGARSTAAPWAC